MKKCILVLFLCVKQAYRSHACEKRHPTLRAPSENNATVQKEKQTHDLRQDTKVSGNP